MTTGRSLQVLGSLLAVFLHAPVTAQQADRISVRGIWALRLCGLLRDANIAFQDVRDTVMTGEDGSGWPSKVVTVRGDEWIIVESSWIDRTHVWRFTTNSSKYQTPHGARVGMSLQDLLDRHQ